MVACAIIVAAIDSVMPTTFVDVGLFVTTIDVAEYGGWLRHSNRNREVLCCHAGFLSSILLYLHYCRQIPELRSSWSGEEYVGTVGSVLEGFIGDYSVDSGRVNRHYGREEGYIRIWISAGCVDRYRDLCIGCWGWRVYRYRLNRTSVSESVSGEAR